MNAAAFGDQVWVARGTYLERILVKEGVALYGGFQGTEAGLSERPTFPRKSPDAAETILGGNGEGAVVVVYGEHAETRADGFTITNGRRGSYDGGGVRCGGQAVIANNTIQGNESSLGGGIYCRGGSPLIVGNVITGNTADYGGGIWEDGQEPVIIQNIITGNTARYDGGGVNCYSYPAVITDNVIENNSASRYGGGISCTSAHDVIIEGNRITSNTARSYGGGIYASESSPTIKRNRLENNYATGIYLSSSPCVVMNNRITGSSTALDCRSSSSSIVNNVMISNGVGIYCNDSSPPMIGNTLIGNSVGIDCTYYSFPVLANNIVAFGHCGIYFGYGTGPILSRNCVYNPGGEDYKGLSDSSASSGDIRADPKLADRTYGNVHLQPDSPCVNMGDTYLVQPGWTDMDGQARVIGDAVDIGADESDGTEWSAGPYTAVRVSPEGSDANDGSSWLSAKRTVQAGINAASLRGGEVWVRYGTYRERIVLNPYAYVYGGFNGAETERSGRSWASNLTVLDGERQGSVVTGRAGDRVSTLDGFTVRNGNAQYGGGICLEDCSALVSNCRSSTNTASFGGGVYIYGLSSDGSYGYGPSSPRLVNVIVSGNGAQRGGGVYSAYASTEIRNSSIAGNTTSTGPGGVYCFDTPDPVIADTMVAFNSSGIGASECEPVLSHCCVYNPAGYNYLGFADPTGSDGNISVDPRLGDIRYGNVHIQPDSPCIDAGDAGFVQGDGADMDGQARVMGESVDIGADESDGTHWPSGPYTVIRVTPDGDDANGGSSWELAKRTVQAGIDAASLQGGEVWVKSGTYRERIVLNAFAYLFGGFTGAETGRTERDWAINTTVLDGEQQGPVVTALAGDSVSCIDGFTITNGNGTNGGGVYCYHASPTIANNRITGNTSKYYGGGIGFWYGSPSISNNVISGNAANNGAGVYWYANSGYLSGNTIVGNSTTSQGGGVYLSSDAQLPRVYTICNNIVAFNSSGVRGLSDRLRRNCVFGNTLYDYSDSFPGLDDILSNPLFVDREDGDYHLTAMSPCINAGWNEAPGLPATDVDGEARIQCGSVDIGADEVGGLLPALDTIIGAKGAADNTWVNLHALPVSAAFADFFYVEPETRQAAIRVDKAGHALAPPMAADVEGVVRTNSDGERYIYALTAQQDGTGDVDPLGLQTRGLGGWRFGLQQGIKEGSGLNNIGLLITTWGTVTHSETGLFYMDDGSAPDDGSGYIGVKVLGTVDDPSPVGKYVKVTGISSCFKDGGDLFRLIRATEVTVIP